MVVTPDNNGNYRAESKVEIFNALTYLNYKTQTADVKIGLTWHPLRRTLKKKRKKLYIKPTPIKRISKFKKILKKLHLYHDPLDILIYRPK